ncbi:two-component system sensor histidine kinase TctE [Gemmobacter caeni]|uniref:histidine kinase n=1 Tax=Gemmobacter caeni TaxID=589035 RepID=A0A2T6B311_9RHOB|nr:sensor histidine kinase [Gemmobacter caeni]PTX50456.1 two-component system sensor histidine kinase TctE [Gemmobacter caeni]TWI98327.1 two-component system sensor histidine kinase TctE [Gemmobacter caeni]
MTGRIRWRMPRAPLSLRQRLLLQLLGIAAMLAVFLYFTVRTVAGQAAETTQDGILGAATTAIAEQLRAGTEQVEIDLPYDAFSVLGSISEDRVFYRIDVGGETVTGYDDLPLPPEASGKVGPQFYTRPFRDTEVRIAAVTRQVVVAGQALPVLVLVAQTRLGQDAIAERIANRAAGLGLGFFTLALLLSLIAAGSVLAPIDRLAEAVARRGPEDLRAVDASTPRELVPLVGALNGFIARLRAALGRTETFITEAAHHIRTPLATVRAQAEIALRQSDNEATRQTLRGVIRAVEESARSATQLLDHAIVVYRSDRMTSDALDFGALVAGVVASIEPAASLKDVDLRLSPAAQPLPVTGDRALLESAVRNILDNAVKYSPEDSVVRLSLAAEDNRAVLRVEDRGRGLSGLDPASLSGRFRRGGNVADVVGSGLGLTIVTEVAAAHDGRFSLTEREGGGVCAEFSVPLQ